MVYLLIALIRTVWYTSWMKSQGRKILDNLVVADYGLGTRTCQVSFGRNNKSLLSLVLPTIWELSSRATSGWLLSG
jgi:hypothetical protein